MFKAILSFIKSFFSSAEALTRAADKAANIALLHADSWLDEALAENKAKAESLNIDPEYKAAKLKALREGN